MLCYSKYMLIIDELDLIDLSYELVSIYVIIFIISSCLVPPNWHANICCDPD
jgi:hypothetical protein